MMTKTELRLQMKNRRNELLPEEMLNLSRDIQQRLFNMDIWKSSKQILIYLSIQSEVDTQGIIKEAISKPEEQKKQVFIPRVEGKIMEFYELKENSKLVTSKFGVPEPDESHSLPFRFRQFMPLMLLPGLVFDKHGNRIGYGAGFYDRYLTDHGYDNFIKIALAYDFQVLERIDAEKHDIRADFIVTPGKIITCNEAYSHIR